MSEMYYMIFDSSEVGSIDFEQVLETSADTLRLSIDGSLTFVKWVGIDIPTCVQNLTNKNGPYTYSQMMDILSTDVWFTSPDMNQ